MKILSHSTLLVHKKLRRKRKCLSKLPTQWDFLIRRTFGKPIWKNHMKGYRESLPQDQGPGLVQSRSQHPVRVFEMTQHWGKRGRGECGRDLFNISPPWAGGLVSCLRPLHSVLFSLKTCNPLGQAGENIRATQIRGRSSKHCTCVVQNPQRQGKQGN